MRRELISDDDLRSKLREHGMSALSEVAAAHLESDGEISVLKRKQEGLRTQEARRRR
jgi:uncharacterized membrane protein YcaP (DUF421 family)